MKKIMMMISLLTVLSLALVGCGQNNQPTPASQSTTSSSNESKVESVSTTDDIDFSEMIEIRGSDTMVNLGQAWAEAFMDKHPEAIIAVTGGGSGTGIAAIINNNAHMAQSSRAMRDGEREQAEANGYELMEYVPGLDGIVIATHVDNPIESLTMAEVKGIYTGEIKNWSEVGGLDQPIVLYSRESSSGTFAFVREFVLEDEEFAPEALLMPSTSSIVDGLKQSENGIGYVGLGYLTDEIKAIPIAAEKGAQAFLPNIQTINSGDYPVARNLYLYTPGEPTGVLKLYMDFIMGPEGQKIVEDLQFIPVN